MTRPNRLFLWTFALAIAGGCEKDDDDDDAAGDGEDSSGAADDAADDAAATDGGSTESGDESSTGIDLDQYYDCVETMIVEARPLVGPGYDAEMGGLLEPMQDEYIVSATTLLVRPEEQEDFFAVVAEVTAQLDQTEGMVAYSLALEPTCGFSRTLSIYRSEEAMMSFSTSQAHAMAIARSSELGITGKVTHWTLPASEFPPTWEMANEKLAAEPPFGGY